MSRLLNVVFILLLACTSPGPAESNVVLADPLELDYARNFQVIPQEGYQILRVLVREGQKADTSDYYLLSRESEIPGTIAEKPIIRIPVQAMMVGSTTHIAMAAKLNAQDHITGVSNDAYIWDESIHQQIEAGTTAVVGEGANLNVEYILEQSPDLLMVSGGMGTLPAGHAILEQAGITVLSNTEWQEETALGRAEWIRLFGILLGKEKEAEEYMTGLKQRYGELKALTDSVEEKPKVLPGLPFKGTWYIPGGESFMAQFVQDAGGTYPWADLEGAGSMPMDFEAVYPVALECPVWIVFGDAKVKDDLLGVDPRVADFASFQKGEIYNNNRRSGVARGNDYYESGVIAPDKILKDFIKALHPELLPDEEMFLFYHVKLE